jgi:hypothetical protein
MWPVCVEGLPLFLALNILAVLVFSIFIGFFITVTWQFESNKNNNLLACMSMGVGLRRYLLKGLKVKMSERKHFKKLYSLQYLEVDTSLIFSTEGHLDLI